jgi:hypothetical protein
MIKPEALMPYTTSQRDCHNPALEDEMHYQLAKQQSRDERDRRINALVDSGW